MIFRRYRQCGGRVLDDYDYGRKAWTDSHPSKPYVKEESIYVKGRPS